MSSLKRLTPIQRLHRQIDDLQRQLGAAGIRPHTIEQVVLSFSAEHGTVVAPWSPGQVISAPMIVTYARRKLGLKFKPTSVSAILCKLTSLGMVMKAERCHSSSHTYTVR